MQHDVDRPVATARPGRFAPRTEPLAAHRLVAQIAFDETEPRPGIRTDASAYLVQIAPMSGGEIVDSDHALPAAQQRLDQMGADEAGRARDEPVPLGTPQQREVQIAPGARLLIRVAAFRTGPHRSAALRPAHSLHNRIPACPMRCGSKAALTSTKTPPGCSFAAIASMPIS